MAQIKFDQIAHAYGPEPQTDKDYALKPITFSWDDGGAYALLGPSGCGKTTLLNICSGLLTPSEGRVWFDDKDVTQLSPERRNIAQVFQFPVLYDSMSVYDNLAFPLRNRKAGKDHVHRRVMEVAKVLSLEEVLKHRAKGLGAELKQKISVGRGLVRNDTSAILFDEPLTVIDPQLKWELRRQLKEVHKQFKRTLIYVTHDQTEALTFADQVVVMNAGRIMQVGTPQALFEQPEHTFVGYFIGSPGMNFLPCQIDGANAVIGDNRIRLRDDQAKAAEKLSGKSFKLGIRPDFLEPVAPGKQGITVQVEHIANMGQHLLVTASLAGHSIKFKVDKEQYMANGSNIDLSFPLDRLCLYADEVLIGGQQEMTHG